MQCQGKGKKHKMDITLLTLVALVVMVIVAALWKGGWQLLLSGFIQTSHLVRTVWLRLLLGFVLGGLITVLIPSSVITEWLGPTSGLKGILIGAYSGIIVGGGGPYVMLPIIASFLKAGAGFGPVIALLASLNLIGLRGLFIWQIPFLGAKLAFSRYVVCLFIPPLVGVLGGLIYQFIISV